MRNKTIAATLLLFFISSVCAQASGNATGQSRATPDVLGAVHVAGTYYLTDKDFLNEGADAILDMGSRVMKIWYYGKRHEHPNSVYPYNSDWPKAGSLAEAAKLPYFRALFDKPFTTYIMVVTSLGRPDAYWLSGISEQDKRDEQRQFYELTKELLTTYRNTGKTFVLQHWEGDWMVRGNFDAKADPTEAALANMVQWLNARQAGVNQARAEVGCDGVRVYHAAEVNRVVSSMSEGRPNMVNKVLPHCKLDLVSYSAWDSATEHYAEPNVLRVALDFIAANTPDSADFGNKNVYIGEFGMPENLYSSQQVQTAVKNAVAVGLDWGCPYIVYWQLYCNELKGAGSKPVKSNDACRGFWLIRPDGSKAWTWNYFHEMLTSADQQIQNSKMK